MTFTRAERTAVAAGGLAVSAVTAATAATAAFSVGPLRWTAALAVCVAAAALAAGFAFASDPDCATAAKPSRRQARGAGPRARYVGRSRNCPRRRGLRAAA
jgi:hypothetical protein